MKVVETEVKEWGHSPALRITKPMLRALGLSVGQRVALRAEPGRLVVEPVVKQEYALAELLAGITEQNRHEEVATGGAVGLEAL